MGDGVDVGEREAKGGEKGETGEKRRVNEGDSKGGVEKLRRDGMGKLSVFQQIGKEESVTHRESSARALKTLP